MNVPLLTRLPPLPQELHELYHGSSQDSIRFRKNPTPRFVNNRVNFTTLGIAEGTMASLKGPAYISMSGKTYHTRRDGASTNWIIGQPNFRLNPGDALNALVTKVHNQVTQTNKHARCP